MTLILDEEFTARPLSNIWLQYDAPDNTINNESSYYTPQNLVLNTGTINGQPHNWLSLQFNRRTVTGYDYSGAGIQIQNSNYIITQGRAEVLARFPLANQGLIGYILMWPADQSWPPEIDFAEIVGSGNANLITFTQHWGNNSTNEATYTFPISNPITNWHIYAVEIDTANKQLRWYIDENLIATQTINFSLSRTWLFSAGTWACNCVDYCGCPTNTVLPQSMDIAYVKLWDAIPTIAMTASLSANPNIITIGQSTTFTTKVSGGIAPYNYSWSGLPNGCAGNNANIITCTPMAIGNYTIVVTVTDSNNNTSNSMTTLTVNPISSINLLQNPAFENGTGYGTSGVPTYWSKYNEGSVPNTPYYWPETGVTGKAVSVNFGYGTRTGRATWVQSIPVGSITGNTSYTVTGSIKLSNVIASGMNNGAIIIIDWFGTSGWLSDLNIIYTKGNLNWKAYAGTVTSPPGAVRANILIGLNHCSGKAYFDNITFYKT